jgi:hypothetical protein
MDDMSEEIVYSQIRNKNNKTIINLDGRQGRMVGKTKNACTCGSE